MKYAGVVDDLVPEFLEAPRTAIEKAVAWGAREVCRRSGAWLVTQTETVDAAGEVMLLPPAQSELVRLVSISGVTKYMHDAQFNSLVGMTPGALVTVQYSVAPTRDRIELPKELYWLDTAVEAMSKARMFSSNAAWGSKADAETWAVEATRLCRNASIKATTGGADVNILVVEPRRFV